MASARDRARCGKGGPQPGAAVRRVALAAEPAGSVQPGTTANRTVPTLAGSSAEAGIPSFLNHPLSGRLYLAERRPPSLRIQNRQTHFSAEDEQVQHPIKIPKTSNLQKQVGANSLSPFSASRSSGRWVIGQVPALGGSWAKPVLAVAPFAVSLRWQDKANAGVWWGTIDLVDSLKSFAPITSRLVIPDKRSPKLLEIYIVILRGEL